MINKNNLEAIKTLVDKIEYTVLSTEKEARVSPIYDDTAYCFYKDDLNEQLATIEKDVIAIYNRNTRDYNNIFASKKQYSNDIDIKRLQLTKAQLKNIDGVYIDVDGSLEVEYSHDKITEKQKEAIEAKIESNIIREKVSATGYSQGEWEEYLFISYKNTITENKKTTLDNIIKQVSYMFTIQEYYIDLVDIETRLYTSGIEEVEEVETESYSVTSYDGYIDLKTEYKNLEAQGYKIINNN